MNQKEIDFDNPQSAPYAGKNALTPGTRATSQAASESVLPKLGTQRRKVYDYFKSRPDGATDQEAQAALNLPNNVQSPRRIELVRAGLVIDSGETRPTPSGKQAVVWKVANV